MWSKSFLADADVPDLPGTPDLLFVFGPTDLMRRSDTLARLRQTYPGAVQVGCSTGSAVAGLTLDESRLQALAVGFAHARVSVHTQPLPDMHSSRDAGQALGAQIDPRGLAGVILLSVGLGVNGTDLVEGLRAGLPRDTTISGGLAGDGDRFTDTIVTVDGKVMDKTVCALALYGEGLRITLGCYGGWDEFGPRRVITTAQGSTLFELDGRPALDLYENYLGDEAQRLPASGLIYPLKIWDPANPEEQFVRTLIGIDRKRRALVLAGDVPQGWRAQLMRGTMDSLVNGAAQAAQQAADAMRANGAEAQLCLIVSCVGRRLLMGQRTDEEVEAVAAVIGNGVPISGFYSYGEIAPQRPDLPAGLHNQTVTLTLIAEAE